MTRNHWTIKMIPKLWIKSVLLLQFKVESQFIFLLQWNSKSWEVNFWIPVFITRYILNNSLANCLMTMTRSSIFTAECYHLFADHDTDRLSLSMLVFAQFGPMWNLDLCQCSLGILLSLSWSPAIQEGLPNLLRANSLSIRTKVYDIKHYSHWWGSQRERTKYLTQGWRVCCHLNHIRFLTIWSTSDLKQINIECRTEE